LVAGTGRLQLNVDIPDKLKERLNEQRKAEGITLCLAVEKALTFWLDFNPESDPSMLNISTSEYRVDPLTREERHLDRARLFILQLHDTEFPMWENVNNSRWDLIRKRARQLGFKMDEVDEFWDDLTRRLLPFDTSELTIYQKNLECLVSLVEPIFNSRSTGEKYVGTKEATDRWMVERSAALLKELTTPAN